jgi:Sugar (and other) transporter
MYPQMAPAFILLVGIQFLPYSPRWLLEAGRDEEAREVVLQMYGTKTAEQKAFAEEEFVQMRDNIKAELHIRSRRLSDLWATKAMAWRTLVAVGVQVFGQFTGINGQFFYVHLFAFPSTELFDSYQLLWPHHVSIPRNPEG